MSGKLRTPNLLFITVLSCFINTSWAVETAPPPPLTVLNDTRDAYSQPSPTLSDAQLESFNRGRNIFRQSWVIPPASDRSAGLGPLYNRISCIACHARNGKGQAPENPNGAMRAMLVRLSVPGTSLEGGPKPHPAYGDQLNEFGSPGVDGEGIAYLLYNEHTEYFADGTALVLRKPTVHFKSLAYGELGDDIMTSPRVGTPVYGLGLLEAIPDATLIALQDQAKPAGISGRVNIVWDAIAKKEAIGRFGAKANVATLEEQVANAFHGDLGMTSWLNPKENCTSVQTACQQAPSAKNHDAENTELSLSDLYATVFYHRSLAVPASRDMDHVEVLRGKHLFNQAYCSSCHIPELRTGDKAPLASLSNQLIQPYTDLLLHDMGEGLADHRPDFLANGREWRTSPLWGIGLAKKVNPDVGFLHDGRARTLLEAIMWHGGEAEVSREAVRKMSASERDALIRYLESI